jgi:cell division protein FtsW
MTPQSLKKQLGSTINDEQMPRRHRPDYALLIISAILITIGLVVIYAISPGLSATSHVGLNYYINKQLLAVGIGLVAFFVAANISIPTLRRLQNPFIIIAAISAIAVRLLGQEVNGAYRWIQVGGISFQSSELIKFAILIWLAALLADRIAKKTIHTAKTLIPVLAAIFLVCLVVAGIQSDLGSTGVIICMIIAMIFVAGVPLKKLFTIGAIVLVIASLAVAVTPYRRERVLTFLHPTSNCTSTGYQACQAIISVGSGGAIGLGLGRSVQAYGYLPEPADDSIFAIFGEKFGFIGSVILVGLFVALFSRIKKLIDRAPTDFTRLILVGILVWLASQSIINIGAMIGLLPLKGITLPFISYGGTSIVFVMAAIGVVFQISHYTTHIVPSLGPAEGKRYESTTNRRRLRGSYNSSLGGRP